MIHKNCGGQRAAARAPSREADQKLLGASAALLDTVRRGVAGAGFPQGDRGDLGVIGDANRYVDEQAPWALRKTDPARMGTVLYVLAETIRRLAILTQPLMPDASAKILDQLAVPHDERGFDRLAEGQALASGTPLPPPQGVFPRFVEEAGS